MRTDRATTRRRLLSVLALGIAGFTGCSDASDTEADRTATEPSPAPSTASASERDATQHEQDSTTGGDVTGEATTANGRTRTTTDEAPLDRKEANVVGVEVELLEGGLRFDVTLNHDDDGEDGYANWWQIEDGAGNRLGRRELLHAHSQQPFTRSETIEIPEGISCVVIRGHDQTHGYGGRAMLVDLETGAKTSVDQGSEPTAFEESDCP